MKNNFFFIKAKKFILLKEINNICGSQDGKFSSKKIYGVNNVENANSDEITFFNNLNYLDEIKNSNALACIVSEKFKVYLSPKTIPIISKNPLIDFYKVVLLFYPESSFDDEKIINIKSIKKTFLGKNSLIDKNAFIGKNCAIGNNVIIKKKVHIGNNCKIGSNVVLENVLIGDNVVIKTGTLIGQAGFGFKFEGKKRIRFPHIGRVIIENEVQIGSFAQSIEVH